MDIAICILVTLLLTCINGFFSASELAVVSAKKSILEPESDKGNSRAKAVLALSQDSGEFLATIQVAITLVGFASSVFAATRLSEPFSAWMVSLGLPKAPADFLAPALITLVVSYLSIVVGELLPKRIALADPEKVAQWVAGPVSLCMHLLKPAVWLCSATAEGIAELLHIGAPGEHEGASEEEIKYLVTDTEELSDEEKTMIREVIDLGDTIAREVMIPRVDMTSADETTTLAELLELMRSTGYSRIPIYRDSVDTITGIAHIKDIISPLVDAGCSGEPVAHYLRKARFVPDTKDIIPLLSEMQSHHDQMVIVVDEYGGTAGIITIEDIVEEVVGEIEDEFDPDRRYLTQLSEREWLVDGRFSLDDAVELGWVDEDSEEYETIAGYVTDLADRLLKVGDTVEKGGYRFCVQSRRGRQISMLKVTALKDGNSDQLSVPGRESVPEESSVPS